MENNIEVNNLSKKYDGFELKNINFAVPKGSIVGFVGENGAGKTTTIKSILNITNANGNIKILGKDIKQHEKEIKQNIGVVLDDSFLSDYLTAKQINSIMKDIYKEVMYYHFVMDLSIPEVAKMLNCKVSTVKQRLVRGKKLLYAQLFGGESNDSRE